MGETSVQALPGFFTIEVICCIVGWKTRAEAMQLSGILLQIKVEYLLNHFYLR